MHAIRDFQFFLCFLMTESRAASRLLRCCVGCGYMIRDIHVCGVELHDGSGGGYIWGMGYTILTPLEAAELTTSIIRLEDRGCGVGGRRW